MLNSHMLQMDVYPQQNYYDYHAPPPPPQNAHYVDMSCGDYEPKCIVM